MNNKRLRPNIVRGGVAIPIPNKKNYYYMKGRKHEQGGIDIGKDPRTGLEVEDGEVMHISPTEVKVFSAVPFLNGESPAEKVIKGNNPNKVFNAQERYKDVNNINDDGTKKKAEYGILDKIDEYAEKSEPYIAGASLGLTGATLAAPNPYTAAGAYLINLAGGGIDAYQAIRHFVKGNYKQGFQNAGEAALSLIGGKAIRYFAKTKAGKQIGAAREKMIDEAYRKRSNNKVILMRKGLTDEQAASIVLTNAANAVDNSAKFRDIKEGIEKNNKKTANTVSIIGDAVVDTNDIKEGINNKKMGGENNNIQYIYEKVNKKYTPDFVRLKDPNRKSIDDWNKKGYTSTNKIAVGTDENGQDFIYNDVQDDGKGGLIDMTNPKNFKNGKYVGDLRAIERGDTVQINSIKDGLIFSKNYKNYYKGFNKKRMGGLSRSKDYGSKSKPYPNVGKKDFAGKNRSYPIPTKADGVDALRLAGLHGRDDIKTKVYSKYPELRKRAKNGGVYTVTSNGKTSLRMIPSTGKRIKFKNGGTEDIEKTIMKKRGYNSLISDGIGIASNITGSIIGFNANKKALDKMKYTKAPVNLIPSKLKTNININPQLDAVRDQQEAYERQIDANTASSRVALGRKQLSRLNTIKLLNNIYANKENTETELINKDKLNQQAVANQNITNYNTWKEKKNAFENAIIEKQSENTIGLINSINAGVQNSIGNFEKRLAAENNIRAIAAANPNVNPIILKALGVRGITNDMIESWLRAYRNKNS